MRRTRPDFEGFFHVFTLHCLDFSTFKIWVSHFLALFEVAQLIYFVFFFSFTMIYLDLALSLISILIWM